MEKKIIQVFYDRECRPYKDQERQVSSSITTYALKGSNLAVQLRFYVDQIGGVENTTWVVNVKLPNGKILYQVLDQDSYDATLGENYIAFDLSSEYTQLKGNLAIGLGGYQGIVEIVEDEDTGIYSLVGTPTIQTTSPISLAINYSPTTPIGEQLTLTDMQQLLGALSQKVDVNNVIEVIGNISTADLSGYSTGQLFYDKTSNLYYKKIAASPYYDLADIGILGKSKILYRVSIDSSTTIDDLDDLTNNYTRLLVANYQSQDYLLGIQKIGEIYTLVIIMFNFGSNDPLLVFKGGTTDNTVTVASFISNNNKVVYVRQTNDTNKVYGTTSYGSQTTLHYDNSSSTGNDIVQRDSNGQIIVPQTPTTNTHATSKKYVDEKVSALGTVLNYKGTKTVAQLNALTGQVAGDVYNVSDAGTLSAGSVTVLAGDNVVWTSNNTWDKLAGTVDLSVYYTKTETDNKFATKDFVLEGYDKEIYTLLPFPYRWTNGVLSLTAGSQTTNSVTCCSNRMFKLKKQTKIVCKNVSAYDFSIHLLNSSQTFISSYGWFTPDNNSLLDYNFFKNLSNSTEYFVFQVKRKDGTSVDKDDLDSNFSVYNLDDEKNELNYKVYIGSALNSGQVGSASVGFMSAVFAPIVFDESFLINAQLVSSTSPKIRIGFSCYKENGEYLGVTGWFEDSRSITGYDIKSKISGNIKYIICQIATNNEATLTYAQIKENIKIYVNKYNYSLKKGDNCCPHNILSNLKNNAFVYCIQQYNFDIGTRWAQGTACYNKHIFQAFADIYNQQNAIIYVVDENDYRMWVSGKQIDLGTIIHCGSMNFGEKQNESDDFPLLYISTGTQGDYSTTTCLVFKITYNGTNYSSSIVRTITIGFSNDDLWTNATDGAQFAVDLENKLLIAYKANGTSSNRVFVFSLPTENKTLTTDDILWWFDVPYKNDLQDIHIKKNKLYCLHGAPGSTLINQYSRCVRVIDYFNKEEIGSFNLKNIYDKENRALPYFNITEPEGISELYENKLLISYNSTSFFAIIDISGSNVIDDFGE